MRRRLNVHELFFFAQCVPTRFVGPGELARDPRPRPIEVGVPLVEAAMTEVVAGGRQVGDGDVDVSVEERITSGLADVDGVYCTGPTSPKRGPEGNQAERGGSLAEGPRRETVTDEHSVRATALSWHESLQIVRCQGPEHHSRASRMLARHVRALVVSPSPAEIELEPATTPP